MNAHEAAELAASLRAGPIGQRESFVFEAVLSDPIGAKVLEALYQHGRRLVPDNSRRSAAADNAPNGNATMARPLVAVART